MEAFYLPFGRGQRFCLRRAPTHALAGAVLLVHAFAEEMNKSRRMTALQADALAAQGLCVLQVDLFGCGDSDGDFGEADWETWVADVVAAAAWLQEDTGFAPTLWGVRAGCLLAKEAAVRMTAAPDLLFWQAPVSGRLLLTQFLRNHVAGQLFGDGQESRVKTETLRGRLEAGETLEIAGYRLSPGVAMGLASAELDPPACAGRVAWLEVAAVEGADVSPATRTQVAAWQAAGHEVTARAVSGPPFWQSAEIEECPDLLAATTGVAASWRT